MNPLAVLHRLCARRALVAFSFSVTVVGCQPPSETTREKGTIDTSGHALVRTEAGGDNHHWSIDVTFRAAPEGTYALVFSTIEPEVTDRSWFPIASDEPALRCAAAHAKGCTLADRGDIVAVSAIGPGGAGVLRAAFDVGPGGWFRLMRIEGDAPLPAPFEVRIVSEALSKDEQAYRFTIEQVR